MKPAASSASSPSICRNGMSAGSASYIEGRSGQVWVTSRFEDGDKALQVQPAIVAGRIRHEEKNYRLLSYFVGSGEVRRRFGLEG